MPTPTASIAYQGNLRTQAVHLKSGSELITDAPTDNNGKGEAFSPTDLVATSLVSCMITVMGIQAQKRDIPMGTVTGDVQKIMIGPPRRIGKLVVELVFTEHNLNETDKSLLENVAINCPVAKSIHPDINVEMKFTYGD